MGQGCANPRLATVLRPCLRMQGRFDRTKHMNRRRQSYSNANPPSWFVFLTGLALVMGMYYLWQGGLSYLSTGGLGVEEATQRAQLIATSTAEQAQLNARQPLRPSPPSPTRPLVRRSP
ncbi:MAG UNVERIFIED_CONTAM: hypothetical protein LVT10_27630 [Anaerolineae bacterium]